MKKLIPMLPLALWKLLKEPHRKVSVRTFPH